ncbi:phytanoyl-CoA dioxygenase [Nitzschia inconspicua]|uniref:Phytanoyl-CoA dioxygenase n=1 Tax=Nitzschia inconspicua TaxID=303405 RepID=A0A9K3PSG5_9STRA|nr:phytanoyl-CoA dioxygenase [Nitzschia inconspicua]
MTSLLVRKVQLGCLVFTTIVSWCTALSSPSQSTGEATFLTDTRRQHSPIKESSQHQYGRVSKNEYVLTPEQIEAFHRDGCVTIEDVLAEEEVEELAAVFDRFVSGEIKIPGKDFCDMSKPFGVPYEEWSLVNCMLPTRYYPPLQNNVYECLTRSMARQLFPTSDMTKDYDQLLNKRPGENDAVFAYHQDMAYWPGKKVLKVPMTDTCTFSLAIDDSLPENGCLRYVVGSGVSKTLRPHRPASGSNRDEGHALMTDVGVEEEVRLAPAKKGSITIHDEYVVHGSGGNTCKDKQRRTYVVAYRAAAVVAAERRIGFTHSHNDEVNWDTFEESDSS